MAVDQPTRTLLERLAERAAKPRHEMTPPEARAAMDGLRALLGDGPDMRREARFDVPVGGGTVPLIVYVPQAVPTGLIVYFHGGGWVVGSAHEFGPLARSLAAATDCAVALLGYRKAPEYPYPTAVEDAWAGLQFCAARLHELVGAHVPVLVAGDSAGANLAIVTAMRARDRGGPPIAAQVLAYPVTDCDFDRPSYTDDANQLMLTRDTMRWYWDQYVPDPVRRAEAEASPLRAGDFTRLPPAVVVSAEHDVLRDEGEEFVDALRAAAVPVTHRCFEGQMHGFLMMVDLLPSSSNGIDFIRNALRERTSHFATNPAHGR